MPSLIRFMLTQFGNGAAMGLVFAQLLLLSNVGDLAHLLEASPSSGYLTALYFAKAAVLFGTLGMSVALMNLPDSRE